MNQIVFAFLLSFIVVTSVAADQNSKAAKIHELMVLQGVQEMIDQARQHVEEQAKIVETKMLAQFNADYPNMEESLSRAFERASNKFMAAVQSSWTTDEAVAAWAKYYGPNLSEKDLDGLIAFYKSPLGRKDVQATKRALPQWTGWFLERDQRTLEQATEAYIAELKAIASATQRPSK